MRGMVLDIETRIDASALASSSRRVKPRGMPPGLQTIAAAAMLEFEFDDDGICAGLSLDSVDRSAAGEPALVSAVERRLAALADAGGRLVTFNGAHDLGIVRLAAARLHRFGHGGAARWLQAMPDAHDDLMLEFSAGGRDTWPRLDDLAASFGITSVRERTVVTKAAGVERMKCELDTIVTMALFLHVLAERARSPSPLLCGTVELVHLMEERLERSPHFAAALRGHLFGSVADR